MTADAIGELEQLLRDEREAIRRLDGARVLAHAERKEAIVASLRGADLSTEDAARLRALAPALRHNSVLLAHARDVLRDAIAATRAEQSASPMGHPAQPAAAAAPRMISVRG
ncbi:MAG TPA: hypothetical protein VE987_07125 [Polyangiaceae bacterium]|nr:hypothetical protein [Polyangiaceae bacterium]